MKAAGTTSFVSFLKPLKFLVDAAYMVLPTFNPYSEKTSQVAASLRGSDAHWMYLFLTLAYSAALSGLFYLLTVYALKKKRYV